MVLVLVVGVLPFALSTWMTALLERAGVADFDVVQRQVTTALAQGSWFIATQAFSIGLDTFAFVARLGAAFYLTYRKCTCYGCHEHTPANVRGKHIEEGIQNFENCVECHRSADGEPAGNGSHEGGGDRKRGKRD